MESEWEKRLEKDMKEELEELQQEAKGTPTHTSTIVSTLRPTLRDEKFFLYLSQVLIPELQKVRVEISLFCNHLLLSVCSGRFDTHPGGLGPESLPVSIFAMP
jgi:hypothetical protein